jgi:ArsR family transcriptional regulator, arsenate/arsenite/antimonite-responsive transcriptional repressor / arsenate reductase (thioredoxin)
MMIVPMPASDETELHHRAEVHAALGEPLRLAIVDALRLSDRSPVELAAELGVASNLLAHHVDVLERAGLVERTVSHADRRRRYLRLHADRLEGALGVPRLTANSVLFVCTRNSARSQLAAALWNRLLPATALSAGTEPADRVHPKAIRAAERAGLDLGDARPRHRDEIDQSVDLVVTVCDQARESLPLHERPPIHWSIPDPATAGTQAAFDGVLRVLSGRVEALARAVEGTAA